MRHNIRTALLLAGLVVGCKGDGSGPTGSNAGTLRLSISSPNGNDGALVLVITGPTITKVTSIGALQVSTAPVGTTGQRVLVLGDVIASGDILTFSVPDTTAGSSSRE